MKFNRLPRLKSLVAYFCIFIFCTWQISATCQNLQEPQMLITIPVTIIYDGFSQTKLSNIKMAFILASASLETEIKVKLIWHKLICISDFDGPSTKYENLVVKLAECQLLQNSGLVMVFTNNGCIVMKRAYPDAPEGSFGAGLTYQERLLGICGKDQNLTCVYEVDKISSEFNQLSEKLMIVHVIGHEVGHALGLDHDKYDTESIMFPRCDQSYGKWTKKNKRELEKLKRDYIIKQALE